MKPIYLDNAATTQIRPEVIASMHDISANYYGNPSSTHSFGRSSKSIIESSRKEIANHLISSDKLSELDIISPNPKTPRPINVASENAQIVQTKKTCLSDNP